MRARMNRLKQVIKEKNPSLFKGMLSEGIKASFLNKKAPKLFFDVW